MDRRKDINVTELTLVAPLIIAPRHAESYKESLERESNPVSPARRASRTRKAMFPRGLWNAGQTCHLGASVTALSGASYLRTWLRMQRPERSSLLATLKRYLLEASVSSERYGLDPRPLLSVLEEASGWKSRHAQDAHETMARILEILEHWNSGLSKENDVVSGLAMRDLPETTLCSGRKFTSKPKECSTMMPFSMVTATSQQCCNCNHTSEVFIQKGSTVILPPSSKVMSLASLFVSSQISCETVEMQCYDCGEYGKHWRNTDIMRLPDLLIIHLQKAVFISGYTKATDGRAIVPVKMEIPEGRPVRGVARMRQYSLRSVVRHYNGSGGQYGHFDCIVRQDSHQGLASISGGASWWHVDDNKVRLTTPEEACAPQKAYLVLYELETYNDRPAHAPAYVHHIQRF